MEKYVIFAIFLQKSIVYEVPRLFAKKVLTTIPLVVYNRVMLKFGRASNISRALTKAKSYIYIYIYIGDTIPANA